MAARTSAFALKSFGDIISGQQPSLHRSVCLSCRFQLRSRTTTPSSTTTTSLLPSITRPFTITTRQQKKSSGSPKTTRKSPSIDPPKKSTHIPNNKHTANVDNEPDPYDYSELQAAIDHAIARLRDALTKTRDAGRVSAEMVENLPVNLNAKDGGGSAHKERTKIGDLASVVPKGGRTMQVFCAEESHIKPLTTSIQSSPYSLTPEPDPNNPLLLIIPVPPATAETRQQAAAEAKKVFDKATLDIRNARGDAQKKFRKMELQKIVAVDELHKAHKGMEDVVKKGQDEAKKVYEGGLRVLQN